MIFRCKNCKGECVSHVAPTDDKLCFLCFQASGWEQVEPAHASDISKSWDGLLGRSDAELKEWCRQAAKDVFPDPPEGQS